MSQVVCPRCLEVVAANDDGTPARHKRWKKVRRLRGESSVEMECRGGVVKEDRDA